MRRHTIVATLITCFMIMPLPLVAEQITLDQFLDDLKKTHPLFEKEALTAEIERESQKGITGAEDWFFNSFVGYSHEEPAIAFAGPERTDAISASAGLDRTFWKTGGRFSASLSTFRADMKINPDFGYPDSYYQHELAVSYTHPLLKNAHGALDQLEYDLKEFDIDFSKLEAEENKESFLAESAVKFLTWVFLNEQVSIFEERHRLSEEELERTIRKREANLVDQADVIRAEDAVRIWHQNQVLIVSQRDALKTELSVLLQNEGIVEMIPSFNLYEIEELEPLPEAIENLKERSRYMEALKVRLEQFERVRDGYTETSRPELYALAEFNIKNADDEFGSSLGLDKPDATVGLQLNIPLENRTARSDIVRTDLQMAQLDKELEELELSLTSTLANLHVQIGQLRTVLALNQEQIESAKERTEEELKLYNQGRGDLTFVILSRDNEQNAKLTHASNALTYQSLIVEYRALMDLLIQ